MELSDIMQNGQRIYSANNDVQKLRNRLRRIEGSVPVRRQSQVVETPSEYTTVASGVTNSSGDVTLTDSRVVKTGSVPPSSIVGTFAKVTTDTSISWYWDGTHGSSRLVINRADGTQFPVPANHLTITGLSANTTYYFYPFWPSVAQACTVGWVTGDTGSPQVAFIAASNPNAQAQQNLQDRESLGIINASTGTTGSTTPVEGGGGGGSLPCVMDGTDIEPLEGWPYVERRMSQSEWIRIQTDDGTKALACVPTHRLYDPLGFPIEARDIKPGNWLVKRQGDRKVLSVEPFIQVCQKVQVVMERGHLYWANDFLSHNNKINPPELLL